MYQKNNNKINKAVLFKASGANVEQVQNGKIQRLQIVTAQNHIHQIYQPLYKLIHDKSVLVFKRL